MKAVFLDRDGTIIDDPGYVHRPEDLAFLPNAIEGLRELQKSFGLFVVSNQSGVARGKFSTDQQRAFDSAFARGLKEHNIQLTDTRYCLHSPNENCTCRKPKTGMIDDLKKLYPIDDFGSWVIGDKVSDVELALSAGIQSILLLTGESLSVSEWATVRGQTYLAKDLMWASRFVNRTGDRKILPQMKQDAPINEARKLGKKIVTLNGSFDVVHEGHEKMIQEAASQGDFLIVALNSDASVSGNKGPSRPLNKLLDRQKMIASFRCVDLVTSFDEPTPIDWLEKTRPDVHVNGADYGADCIEAPIVQKYGGKIHIVELIQSLSTTDLLKKKLRG